MIVVVGLNHKTAPVEVRERLAFSRAGLGEALRVLRGYVSEGVILSTCNRTEVYGVVGHPGSGAQAIKRFLADYQHLDPATFEPYLYTWRQTVAVRHIFEVASGLDSMILGEEQILGQVRDAFKEAQDQRAVGPLLSSLFRYALRLGKRVRAETEMGKNRASVSAAAVELARRIGQANRLDTILVIGAGEVGKLTARTLAGGGVGRILVTSRTYEKAWELANQLGGEAVAFSHLAGALARSDAVISSTSARGFVIDAATAARALQVRGGRPIFFIDIAVPRDIDPEVKKLENAFLYDIDDLHGVGEANHRELEKARAMVEEEVAKFNAWWDSREVVPTITALRKKLEGIRRAELAKAATRLGHLSERDQNLINALTGAIINKVLHDPIVRLKAGDSGRQYARAVRELFQLEARSERSPGRVASNQVAEGDE